MSVYCALHLMLIEIQTGSIDSWLALLLPSTQVIFLYQKTKIQKCLALK